jgi:hypothetical protein
MQGEKTKKTHTLLSEAAELTVLLYFSRYKPSAISFRDYAKNRVDILGSEVKTASEKQKLLRRKVTNRVNYLKTHRVLLIKTLKKKGLKHLFGELIDPELNPGEEDIHEDQEQNEILSSIDKLNRKSF